MKKNLTLLIYIPIGAALGVLLNLLISATPLPDIFPYYNENAAPAFYSIQAWAAVLLFMVAAPVLEELLFRVFLFNLLRQKLGLMPASVLSSILFGIYHGNAVQMAYAFCMGMAFSLLYDHDHRIPVPIILHASANAAVYFLLR